MLNTQRMHAASTDLGNTTVTDVSDPKAERDSGRDPGRWARRLVRVGALLPTLLLFWELWHWHRLPGEITTLWDIILYPDMMSVTGASFWWPLGTQVFLLWALPAYTAAPFMVWTAGASTLRPGWGRNAKTWSLFGLSLLSIAPAYVIGVFWINRVADDIGQAALLGTLSAYLLVVGLTLVTGLHRRRDVDGCFWLGLCPLACSLIAWSGMLAAQVVRPFGVEFKYIALSVMGLAGSAAMLAGWLAWWRAVRKARP